MDRSVCREHLTKTMDLDNGRVVFGDPNLETHVVVTDPVCGKEIKKADAVAAADYRGTIYYFCSPACKARFAAAPEQFIPSSASP
jgi:YHS domain-containing protein